MVQNSKFTVQLLEKIGAPLASAIESVPLDGDDTDVQAAKIMAQLMGQAVQISIALNTALNVVEDGAQADSTRLALAALVAPLLADFCRNKERVPEAQDIKRLTKSLEAVIAFADNFSAAEDEKSRLATIDHDAPLFDKTQSTLVVMQAMTPALIAIGEFSFGQSETKLTQDVAGKIEAAAKDIAQKTNLTDKLSELMIVKALAALYADCHQSQTQKLANDSSDEARGELSLDPVWEAFGKKVAMIETVMGIEAPANAPSGDAVAPVVVAAPVVTAEASAPQAPLAAAPATASPSSPPSNPMGFFKKPDTETSANAATAMTPEAPAQQQPTVSPPPVQAPATLAEPVAPPAQQSPLQQEAAQSSEPPAAPPSNPMGFFKKKPDDNGEQA